MNCATIDSILDERRVARLSPAERQEATQHVGGCARCTETWLADEALCSEAIADPPPELFATLSRRAAAAPVRPYARRTPWIALVGTAAAVALVAVFVVRGGALPASSLNAITIKAARVIGFDAPSNAVAALPTAVVVDANALDVPTAAIAAAPAFVAGRDYEVLRSATALPATAEGIPVTEFFMYLCFPCYSFEPELVRWDAQTAGQVSLTRVPAVFNPAAELQARAFYTAEVLGKLDAMHAAFYDEIHTRGNPLGSRAALAEFFARFGVDAATFGATFDSREVDARVRRAVALSEEYGIRATPSLVVAGRYRTNPILAGLDMLAVVDHVVAKERAASCPAKRRPDCQ
jgi:protein dithiol oxidoreductase (disulfide-forming)